MPKIHIARLLTDNVMSGLADLDQDMQITVGAEEPPARKELLTRTAGVDAAIVTLTERIDEEFFVNVGSQLRVVANVAVGFDNIDLAAADKHGVIVTNTPGVLDGATADHTFALILTLSRRVVEADRYLHEGHSWVWGPRMFVGLDVSAGATIGIIGLGRIGRAVAQRARAFGMHVVAADPTRTPGEVVEGAQVLPLDDVLASSDVVTLHVPLTPSTRHLIDATKLEQMKTGSYLVNAARGGIVDEEALIHAIDSGHLRGAAIDTFEGEPHVNPQLLARPQIVVTPHIASAGEHTRDQMCQLAVDNVTSVLQAGRALTPVLAR